MKKIQGIYLIERIGEELGRRYYVGLAKDIFRRLNGHCCPIKAEQYIDKEIKRIGLKQFNFSILEVVKDLKDIKKRESYWIDIYKERYSEELLYNIQETNNLDPYTELENRILPLFKNDIGQSIYAIAEFYQEDYKDILDIRKKVLKKMGLVFDKKLRKIVCIENRKEPDNWRGGLFTKSIVEKIEKLRQSNPKISKTIISNECNVSKDDLAYYFMNIDNYQIAEEFHEV